MYRVPSVLLGNFPSGINPQGDMVGFYIDGSGNAHGFLRSKGRLPKSMYLQPLESGRKRMGSIRKATSWVSILTAAA
jgi:hypothetical protein